MGKWSVKIESQPKTYEVEADSATAAGSAARLKFGADAVVTEVVEVLPPPPPPPPTGEVLFYDSLVDFDNWAIHSPEYNGTSNLTPAQTAPWIERRSGDGSPYKNPQDVVNPYYARFLTKQGVQSAYDRGRNSATRTGFYKGYQYKPGEISLTTIDVRRWSAGFPANLADSGGGLAKNSQLAQEKAWGDVVDFMTQQVAKDGVKFHLAAQHNVQIPCAEGKWMRMGIKASWRSDSQGWYEWWMDKADGQGFKQVSPHRNAQLLNRPGVGDCFLCLGLYHALAGWGDVIIDLANPTVAKL
jgi:hypothetical protein